MFISGSLRNPIQHFILIPGVHVFWIFNVSLNFRSQHLRLASLYFCGHNEHLARIETGAEEGRHGLQTLQTLKSDQHER